MDTLMETARAAVDDAYAPYSEYAVGAALETETGAVFTGANVEVANYSNSLHAEEVALGQAVATGHREFSKLAVSSSARDGVTPCGMCRQSLAEFCAAAFPILCEDGEDSVTEHSLGELLPSPISGQTLEDAHGQ
jgi:cytidine deaminase